MTISWVLWAAMGRKQFVMFRRYAFNSALTVVIYYVIFLLLFFGAGVLARGSPDRSETLSAVLVSFLVGVAAIEAYSRTASEVHTEATEGTLEQLALAKVGLGQAIIVKVNARFVWDLVMFGALMLLAMATSGHWLNLQPLSVLPLLLVTVLGVQGIGLAMGGLSLLVKEVSSAIQVLFFVFAGLSAVSPSQPVVKYLPLAWGRSLIERVMVHDASITTISSTDLVFLVANSAAYFAAGLLGFKYCERVARDRGLIGHY